MDAEIFRYFLLTLVIELPVIILFYPGKWKLALLIGILVNAFTWPLLQVVLLRVDRDWLTPLEVIITFIEAIGLYLFSREEMDQGAAV